MTELVVGAPAWDRAWALPLWFQSVRANVDPAKTGLVFVVPASDTSTRTAIRELSEGFGWVEVIRDRGKQLQRDERPGERHATLATARNQILQVVTGVRPDWFLSWDTDLLLPRGSIKQITDLGVPICTAWTWLNRQAPKPINHFDGENHHEVLWQDPVAATAMAWDPRNEGRAVHYPGDQFCKRSQGVWRCAVTLALQVMDRRAYAVANYRPHHDGEDVTFARQLERQGVPRYCHGGVRGVHLYDRSAREEKLGWPDVLRLADEVPLAASYKEQRSPEHEAFGFFPTPRSQVHA